MKTVPSLSTTGEPRNPRGPGSVKVQATWSVETWLGSFSTVSKSWAPSRNWLARQLGHEDITLQPLHPERVTSIRNSKAAVIRTADFRGLIIFCGRIILCGSIIFFGCLPALDRARTGRVALLRSEQMNADDQRLVARGFQRELLALGDGPGHP